MKKFLLSFLILFALFNFFGTQRVNAANDVNIYFFHGDGCPHCAEEQEFLKTIEGTEGINIYKYEIWYDKDNQKFLKEISDKTGLKVSGVPITIINDKVIYGFGSAETTGAEINKAIQECKTITCEDIIANVAAENNVSSDEQKNEEEIRQEQIREENKDSFNVNIPFIGTVNLAKFSLPVITIIIGAIDGFNPCAMWVLLFLITMLFGMKDKRKMWILGSAFIIASGFVYFLFLSAWLNIILFLGFIVWIRVIIGIVAIGSGIYHLREYWTNKNATCKVTKNEREQKIFEKIKDITSNKNFLLALGGIILLAFAVNLVELVCSAGLPAIYTQILTLSELNTWSYYAYLFLYIIIFMLDDIIIFVIAMKTLEISGTSAKYTRSANLIGGIIILILGILLIVKPELLMFG